MTKIHYNSGFTLLETVLSLALTALLIAILSIMTRQWIADWNLGRSRMSTLSAVALAQERLEKELRSAIPIRAQGVDQSLYFSADENHIAFVREPEPLDGTDHLMLVEYRNDETRGIIRRTAILNIRIPIASAVFGEPVRLLEPPFQMRLSYEYSDNGTQDENAKSRFPDRILVAITRENTRAFPPISISLPVTLDRICSTLPSFSQCKNMLRGNTARGPKDTVTPSTGVTSPSISGAAP